MTSFDSIAAVYDQQFTDTQTGFLQRQLVYAYLDELLIKHEPKRVLELNCGTGADAIFMAQKSCDVIATDISAKMIATAQEKAQSKSQLVQNRLQFKTMAIENMDQLSSEGPFDLIFSNFGGLNCVSPKDMKQLVSKMAGLLSPNGRLVFVIMSRFCPWESAYFLAKRNWSQAWRRRKYDAVDAPLGDGVSVPTWYYSPKMMTSVFKDFFQLAEQRPIGFFIPPSYLDPAFVKRPRLLNYLWKAEQKYKHLQWLAPAGDHFLIDMKLISSFGNPL